MGEEHLSFEELARYFLETLTIQSAVVTRGELGATVLLPGRVPIHLPATALEVADVTGAGDTFVGTYALAVAVGYTCLEAAELATVAAGVAVGRLGAATVSREELVEALRNKATRPNRRMSR
jgi:D-beta-D-heptose 7-phosphate kinase/D-beta-D-heptose 1-phosphate adenosyltransferase